MIPLTHDDFKGGQTAESTKRKTSTSSASASRLLTPASVPQRRPSLLVEGPTGSDVMESGSGLLSGMAAATSAAAFVAALAVPSEPAINASPEVAVVVEAPDKSNSPT